MNQQTIDNKLIAEFMAFARYTNDHYKCKYHNHPKIILLSTKQMKFKNDWNWLIPVVDKINKIVDKNNYGYGIGIRYAQIKPAYKLVVKFIKWYNKQGK